MKKIAALLLALILCLGSLPAFADVDLSAYTQEELLSLRDKINQELLKRGIIKVVAVPIGMYIVGEDIPAGAYTIKPERYSWIDVYTDESMKKRSFGEGLQASKNEYIGKLILEDGNLVSVEEGTLFFSPYQGLGF